MRGQREKETDPRLSTVRKNEKQAAGPPKMRRLSDASERLTGIFGASLPPVARFPLLHAESHILYLIAIINGDIVKIEGPFFFIIIS